MAGTEITQGARGPQKKGPGGRRPKRRVGIRIDMTPMVDVAFLLLIFFMVTTVFRRPLAMEVNMPEPGAKVEVPESNVMTVYVREDGVHGVQARPRRAHPRHLGCAAGRRSRRTCAPTRS